MYVHVASEKMEQYFLKFLLLNIVMIQYGVLLIRQSTLHSLLSHYM